MSNSNEDKPTLYDIWGQPIPSVLQTGSDYDKDKGPYKHQFDATGQAAKLKNFDEKMYMFPPSFNALRKELSENWPELWKVTQWRMAYKAEEFIEQMNAALDMTIVFDTEKVGWICEQYLVALRKKRGFSQ